MPRQMQRSRPANRPGQTRGGRRGQLEAFERAAEQAAITAARAGQIGPIELPSVVSVSGLGTLVDATPERLSAVVNENETSVLFHPASLAAGFGAPKVNVGGVLSILIGPKLPALAVLPALSLQVPVLSTD